MKISLGGGGTGERRGGAKVGVLWKDELSCEKYRGTGQ